MNGSSNNGSAAGQHPLAGASQALAGSVEKVAASVVAVHAARHGAASGVAWRNGVVVTTAHSVRREDGIKVTLPDGSRAAAVLAGTDASTDLAVLEVDGLALPVAATGNADEVRTGHFVFAVARDAQAEVSASFGIVGATGGAWRTWRGGRIDRLIRLDGGLYPGFSGGPIADTEGRVIGIGTSALMRGFGVAIPAATVDRVTDQLLANGRVASGYLGVGTQSIAITEALAGKLGLASRQGLIVLSVAGGGPADAAGVLVSDILIAVAGNPVADISDLQAQLGSHQAGDSVPLTLIRGGERIESLVTLGERPQRRC